MKERYQVHARWRHARECFFSPVHFAAPWMGTGQATDCGVFSSYGRIKHFVEHVPWDEQISNFKEDHDSIV
jgi:hypothetical protein